MVCDPLCSSTKKKRGAEWSVNPWLAKVSIHTFHIYGITAKRLVKEFQSALLKWVDLISNLKFEEEKNV